MEAATKERFDFLIEEMGEVLQILGKINRHGMESYNPFDPSKTPNRELLAKELADVRFAIDRIVETDDISKIAFAMGISERRKGKGKQYFHHQGDYYDN